MGNKNRQREHGSVPSQLAIPPSGDPRTPASSSHRTSGSSKRSAPLNTRSTAVFAHDDTNVILLPSNPNFSAKMVTSDVQTAQVATTILKALDLDLNALHAVQLEGTPVLPAVQFASRHE